MVLIMTAQAAFFNDFSEKDPHFNAVEFTGWSCQRIFYSNTYTDCLVAEFPVLEHLYSTSLLEVYFLFSVENEKLTEVVNA